MKKIHYDFIRVVLLFFVVVLILNFYVNVWTQDLKGSFTNYLEDHNRHSGKSVSMLLWKQQVYNKNATFPQVLPSPPTTTASVHATPAPIVAPLIWRDLQRFSDDRILAQMEYIPHNNLDQKRNTLLKKILLIDGFKAWGMKPGQQTFLDDQCPVSSCTLTANRRDSKSADAVLFQTNPRFPWYPRTPNQLWILYMLESPYHTPNFHQFQNIFNLTATYRRDSDIVTPYEKFVKYSHQPNKSNTHVQRNYAAGKTKKVAWFVSNCQAQNERLQFAKELQKYIQVDIIGKCGNRRCPKNNGKCHDILDKDYKFYLSFENSNCRDYITEKFFVNGLKHDVIPIVMGAAPEDYERVAPHYSYIHVDHYGSPKILANYLHVLDSNDDLYNEYFQWKGTGEFINTKFWCRLCALLHDDTRSQSSYGNLNQWWRGRDVCIGKDSWIKHPRHKPYISGYYEER